MSVRKEINGNHPPSVNKRRNSRDRRHTGPVNFNCSKPAYNCDSVTPSSVYCTGTGHSMFPAISDPSLCYPYMSYHQMPFEPLSLPTYNLYQPYSYRNHACTPPQVNCYKIQDSDQEYTSLPCVNNDLNEDGDNKRRFSDPGIPNEFDAKSDQLVHSLMDQVNYLKDSNRKLCRELQDMRSELSFLKQQFGARFCDKEYKPGMLSDIVREIRDAARVREEALLSRVKHMIEERQMAMSHLHIFSEKARNNDRIGKLEEQMKHLCLNNSVREDSTEEANSSADQVLELEQATLVLRRELQEAIAGKKDADAKIFQLDQMLTTLRQKFTNADLLASNDDVKTASSVDNCSLTTKSASPVARVVMSGPVTSL
ncbi:uncharacterized protein CBL_03774 [Carabus blaptoides fortunei]